MSIHLRAKHQQHIASGVIFAILASISFTLMSLMTKFIGDGASTGTIVFARFFISLIFILPWVIRHPKETLKIVQPFRMIFRTIFTLLALTSFFYILKFISLTEGLLLNNTSPLFVPLIVLITHRAKTPHKLWIGIILGFIGIGFVLKPGIHLFQPVALIGLASGIFAAIAYVIIRSLTKTRPILQILFYNFFICSLISGFFLLFSWRSFDFTTSLLLLAVGIFGSCYQFFSIFSIAKAPIRITSSLQFLSIVFGVLADFLIWNQTPDLYSLIGIILVILGGVLTIYFGQKELNHEIK